MGNSRPAAIFSFYAQWLAAPAQTAGLYIEREYVYNTEEVITVKIFIVEDDETIAGAVARHIESWGWEARVVSDLKNVLGEFADYDPQLVLMDVGLPFFNGYHWCARIRSVSKVPIIFISSASDNMNIVMAVNMGADDFIAKPFDLQVLTAKVQALLRRSYDFSASARLLRHGDVILNLDEGSLSYKKQKTELTKNELRIMQVLMENQGKTVSREVLMQRLWETDSFVDENTLSVNVARLRKKLEAAGLSGFILTRKGLGYMVG